MRYEFDMAWVGAASGTGEPGNLTQAVRDAEILGISPEMAQRLPEEARKKAVQRALARNPGLARYGAASDLNASVASRHAETGQAVHEALRLPAETGAPDWLKSALVSAAKLSAAISQARETPARALANGFLDVTNSMLAAARSASDLGAGQESAFSAWIRGVQAGLDAMRPELPREMGAVGQFGLDVTRAAPQLASQIGVALTAGPLAATGLMAAQIYGGSYDQLTREGVDPKNAASAAAINAGLQSALERIGLGAMLKGLGSRAAFGAMLRGATVEGTTEALQKMPEYLAHIWARSAKVSDDMDERIAWSYAQATSANNLLQGTREAIYEGLIGAVLGGAASVALSGRPVTPLEEAEYTLARSVVARLALDQGLARARQAAQGSQGGDPAGLVAAIRQSIPENLRRLWLTSEDARGLLETMGQARLAVVLNMDAEDVPGALESGAPLGMDTAEALAMEGGEEALDAARLEPEGVNGAEARLWDPVERLEATCRLTDPEDDLADYAPGPTRQAAAREAQSAQRILADTRRQAARLRRAMIEGGLRPLEADANIEYIEAHALANWRVYGVDPASYLSGWTIERVREGRDPWLGDWRGEREEARQQRLSPRGQVEIDGEKRLIRLFDNRNAATVGHEAGHIFIDDLIRLSEDRGRLALDAFYLRAGELGELGRDLPEDPAAALDELAKRIGAELRAAREEEARLAEAGEATVVKVNGFSDGSYALAPSDEVAYQLHEQRFGERGHITSWSDLDDAELVAFRKYIAASSRDFEFGEDQAQAVQETAETQATQETQEAGPEIEWDAQAVQEAPETAETARPEIEWEAESVQETAGEDADFLFQEAGQETQARPETQETQEAGPEIDLAARYPSLMIAQSEIDAADSRIGWNTAKDLERSHIYARDRLRKFTKLNGLIRKARAQRQAIAQAARDLETLKQFAGIEGEVAPGGESYLKLQEAGARAIEAWLREGNAPVARLAPAFGRLSSWLSAIYREYAPSPLTREVSEVFARMLATPQELRAEANLAAVRENERGLLALDGLSEETRARLAERLRAVEDRVRSRLAGAARRKRERQRKIREREIYDQLGEQPFWQIVERVALDPDSLRAALGSRAGLILDKLRTSRETGATLAEAAAESGYDTAEDLASELLTRLTRGESRRSLAREAARAEMVVQEALDAQAAENLGLEEYGRYLEKADQAVVEILARGRSAAARAAARYQGLIFTPTGAVAAQARKLLDRMQIGAISPQRFRAMLTSAMDEREQALSAGQYEQALAAISKARVAVELMLQSARARQKIESARKLASQIASAKNHNLAAAQLEALRKLFAGLGLAPISAPLNPLLHAKTSLRELVSQIGEDDDLVGASPAFSDWLLDLRSPEGRGLPLRFNELNLQELDEVVDLIKYLRHSGGRVMKESREAEAEIAEKCAGLMRQLPEQPALRKGGLRDRARDMLDWLFAEVDLLQWQARKADGLSNIWGRGQTGPMEELYYRVLWGTEAVKSRRDQTAAALAPHIRHLASRAKALEALYGEELAISDGPAQIQLPARMARAYGRTRFTVDMVYAMALNCGNESNITRLAKGYHDIPYQTFETLLGSAMARRIVAARGESFASGPARQGLLTGEDWQAIQGIWDGLNMNWPDIVRAHSRMFGFAPARVEAAPFRVEMADGSIRNLRGGYYPARYDPLLSDQVGAWNEQENLLARNESMFQTPAARRGFTISRKNAVNLPLLLDTSPIVEHIDDTARFIELGGLVRQIDRITRNENFRAAYTAAYGRRDYDAIRPNLRGLLREEKPEGSIAHLETKIRKYLVPWGLSWNPKVAALQATAIFPAMNDLGVKNVCSSLSFMARHRMAALRDIWQASPYLKSRLYNLDQDLQRKMSQLSIDRPRTLTVGGREYTWDDIVSFGIAPIAWVDAAATGAVWLAAYRLRMRDYMEGKLPAPEARPAPGHATFNEPLPGETEGENATLYDPAGYAEFNFEPNPEPAASAASETAETAASETAASETPAAAQAETAETAASETAASESADDAQARSPQVSFDTPPGRNRPGNAPEWTAPPGTQNQPEDAPDWTARTDRDGQLAGAAADLNAEDWTTQLDRDGNLPGATDETWQAARENAQTGQNEAETREEAAQASPARLDRQSPFHAACVAYADAIVKQSNPDYDPPSRSAFLRSRGVARLFNVFTSATSLFASRLRFVSVARKKGKVTPGQAARDNYYTIGLPAASMFLLLWLLRGYPGDEPGESAKLAGASAMEFLNLRLPVFGPALSDIILGATDLSSGPGRGGGVRMTVNTPFELAQRAANAAGNVAFGKNTDRDKKQLLYSTLDMISFASRIPFARWIRNTDKGLEQYRKGKGTPLSPLSPRPGRN